MSWTSTPTPDRVPSGWTANPKPAGADSEGWFSTRSYPKDGPAAVAGAVALAPMVVLDIIGVPVPPALAAATALAPVGRSDVTGSIPAAQLAATALAPTTRVDVTPAVPSASAAASGLAPSARQDINATVPPAVGAGAGAEPQVIISHIANVDAAVAAATGLEPSVRVDIAVSIPAAGAALIGLAPEGLWYQPPQTTQYQAAGTYTYNIPLWANYLDIIMIGGGGGGASGSFGTGDGAGGYAGEWFGVTLVRGVDFPQNQTQITVVVGAGGAGGSAGFGKSGQASTVGFGSSLWSAPGGGTRNWQNNSNTGGSSAGNFTYNGVTYIGGAAQNTLDRAGNPPGGGGAGGNGGFIQNNGGAGARGEATIIARST